MSRFTAPSSDDYADEIESRTSAYTAILHCPRCGEIVPVEADEPGPVICASCLAVDSRNDATGHSHEAA